MTDEYNEDRLFQGFVVGTLVGTVFSTPINYSAHVYGFKYDNPISAGTLFAGSVGINSVQSLVVAVTTARFSTITGTIDIFSLNAAGPNIRDSFGTHPVGRIEAGDQLTAAIINVANIGTVAASIMGVVSYKLVPGRVTGP